MKIVMQQSGHELLNLGDLAMLQVSIGYLRQHFPDARIKVFNSNPERLAAFVPGTDTLPLGGLGAAFNHGCLLGGLAKRYRQQESEILYRNSQIAFPVVRLRRWRRGLNTSEMNYVIESIRSADLVIATGGGYLTDAFPTMVNSVCHLLSYAQSLHKPTAMFGQGLGPLQTPELRDLTSRCLSKLDILSLREGLTSPNLARELGVASDKVYVTGDDAVKLSYQNRVTEPGYALGLNVRSTSYSGVVPAQIEMLRTALVAVLNDLDAPPVILPISLDHSYEDARMTSSLISTEFDAANEELTPVEVIKRAGTCRLVITGSYHAGVFALSQGVPVIGLCASPYYAAKFAGLAAQFGSGCRALDINQPDFHTVLKQTARTLWETSYDLKPTLLGYAEQQVSKSEAVYAKLNTLVKG